MTAPSDAWGKTPMKSHRLFLLLAVALYGLAGSSTTTSAAPGSSVTSMAALGDSITAAWGSPGWPDISNHLENSWATGTAAAVSSHASRFAPGPTAVVNLAKSGISVADPTQGAVAMAQALPDNIDYVVFEGGSADLCGPWVTSPDLALSPAAFQAAIAGMLSLLQSHLAPGGRVLLASIPNWHRIWEDFPTASLPSGTRPPFACPLLFSPAANDASRNAEAAFNAAYNAALQQACAAYLFCRYDGGAVYGIQFLLADLSTTDYFHLSVSGQAKLAAATWPLVPPAGTPPTISGTLTDGQTLSGSDGTWGGLFDVTLTRQWQRCDPGGAACQALGGATGSTYLLGAADVGSKLRL